MILQIKSRFTDAVLYSGEGKTLGEVVVAAVSSGADLRGANLSGANLRGASLLAPAVMLASGFWGELSNDLTADLMLWDASAHPNPEMFDAWAKGGPCPYGDGRVQRACHFYEQRRLWGKGQVCRPWDLWERLRAEKCPDWSDEEVAAFEAKFKKE